MAILDFLNKPMFSSRFKLPLHIITGVLVVIVIGLSVPRLFMKNQPRTRASTIALGMGAKSLILLAYMLATEHVQKLKRWHSYKANVIISCLEIVFWGAVAFLVFQGNLSRCEGITCYLSWVVVGIAVVVNQLEIYGAAISIREFREYRKMRDGMPLTSAMSRNTDEEEMVQRFPNLPDAAYHGQREQRAQREQQYAAPPRYHGHSQVVHGKQ